MEFTNEEKEYIKKYEEKFHVLTDEEKEYIIKIKRENNIDKTKKELNNFFSKNECHCIKDGDLPKENQDLKKQIEELKAKIEKMADCSNCKHWHYSTRLLVYVCDCSDMISNSTDSRTYEHCDKWELE